MSCLFVWSMTVLRVVFFGNKRSFEFSSERDMKPGHELRHERVELQKLTAIVTGNPSCSPPGDVPPSFISRLETYPCR